MPNFTTGGTRPKVKDPGPGNSLRVTGSAAVALTFDDGPDPAQTPQILALLGQAGCVSIEAGVESITVEGRNLLDKGARLTTGQIVERLVEAKRHVPFVQANLLESGADAPGDVERWRQFLRQHDVWANKPVPMFPYPGSPEYGRRWGEHAVFVLGSRLKSCCL